MSDDNDDDDEEEKEETAESQEDDWENWTEEAIEGGTDLVSAEDDEAADEGWRSFISNINTKMD